MRARQLVAAQISSQQFRLVRSSVDQFVAAQISWTFCHERLVLVDQVRDVQVDYLVAAGRLARSSLDQLDLAMRGLYLSTKYEKFTQTNPIYIPTLERMSTASKACQQLVKHISSQLVKPNTDRLVDQQVRRLAQQHLNLLPSISQLNTSDNANEERSQAVAGQQISLVAP